MNGVDVELVADHFDKLLSLKDNERSAFISSLTDENLKKELLSLLGFSMQELDYLEHSVSIPLAEQVPDFAEGEVVKHFVIIKKIGQGSFGKVYLAHDKTLERQIALKVTPIKGSEALVMAHLDHENIVKIFSEVIEEIRNLRLICMQYIKGRTLSDYMAEEKISYEYLIKTFLDLTRAVQTAHHRGVLHLDIKPENILINEEGKAFLTDFNVSKADHRNDSLFGGTSNYMSPEQESALLSNSVEAFTKLDERADLYSLALVFKKMYAKVDPKTVLKQVQSAIESILAEASEKNIQKRTKNSEALCNQLESLNAFDRMLKKAPPQAAWEKFTLNIPRVTLFLVILMPQVLASIVNIFYNAIRIVSHLNPEQQETFKILILIINPIIYSIAIYFIYSKLTPIFNFLRDFDISKKGSYEEIMELTISGPKFLALLASCGWTAGMILFPTLIHLLSPSVPSNVFFHFFVSFFLSWLVAITYSFLNAQYFLIRQIYPRIWLSPSLLLKDDSRCLKVIESRLKRFPFLAGAVPMFGALAMVLVGTEADSSPLSLFLYKALLVSFLMMGMAGLAFAVTSTRKMLSVLYSFKD